MIAIIDYEIGNLRSVHKAIERVGGTVELVSTPAALARAQRLILPGVAAFGDAMAELRRKGLADAIVRAIGEGMPYLGFCLGLQLLFEVSREEGEHAGLGVLGGEVRRLQPTGEDGERLRVPHMGWNQLRLRGDWPLFEGIAGGAYVYFAHSYCVVPTDETIIAATTDYGGPFVSAVGRGNIFATQFHPEKSQSIGMKMLENFVKN